MEDIQIDPTTVDQSLLDAARELLGVPADPDQSAGVARSRNGPRIEENALSNSDVSLQLLLMGNPQEVEVELFGKDCFLFTRDSEGAVSVDDILRTLDITDLADARIAPEFGILTVFVRVKPLPEDGPIQAPNIQVRIDMEGNGTFGSDLIEYRRVNGGIIVLQDRTLQPLELIGVQVKTVNTFLSKVEERINRYVAEGDPTI
ncbi:MAG: hypothetical protein ABIE03_04200 [Patescibacteria group bacterium]|nr:hypothetical protein [Patescibacteria group bacterium]